MAEALARRVAGCGVQVESAGIEAADGIPATEHAVTVMAERGADIKSHRSRSVESVDILQFDVVIAMTPWIADRLRRLGVDAARIRSMQVEDPYCKGVAEYRRAADGIEQALQLLAPELR
jgi:protein-tyrosine-phosphatase